uniref:ATP synthase F0 subunit 8 n=1 Tax=Placosternum urus TaxID=2575660 RepID=A0A4D6X0L9_9HEMI|nr:ATP synthase F0 subunit 8 [Placosternum urus]QCI09407.1 ATP synthase F0 subunit 8 [Placosternum urus]
MPQMSPLWWEMLFLVFIMSLMMFNIIIYFMQNKMNLNKNLFKNDNIQFIWKW